MVDSFVEGVRSLVQVCHLTILAPVALTIVAARGRWPAVIGAIAGTVVGGWVFVAGWVTLTDLQLRVSALAVIAAVAAIVALDVRDLPIRKVPGTSWIVSWMPEHGGDRVPGRQSWLPGAVTAGVAIVVTQWWRPCVGTQLGVILTEAPGAPFGQLPGTIGFMAGISMPLVLIGLAYLAWNAPERALRTTSWTGGALAVLLAASVVAGQHGEIVSRLFRWSQ